MPNYFTRYWNHQSWHSRKTSQANTLVRFLCGNVFIQKQVMPADHIYIVTIIEGRLFLNSKIVVGGLYDIEAGAAILQTPLPPNRNEVIIASAATPQRYDLAIPDSITQGLRFLHSSGTKALTFRTTGQLDPQTLRTMRRLTPTSAATLDRLLPPLEPLHLLPAYQP